MDIELVNIKQEDIVDVFKWRNDPIVRNGCFNQGEVSRDEHIKWFETKEKDPLVKFFIVKSDDNKIGVVRFEFNFQKTEAEISILLNPSFIGQGFGTKTIITAVNIIFDEVDSLKIINAHIRKDNSVSIKAFTKSGFKADR